ncbi:DUF2523 domain-containing protein [Pseudomonas citronellolis]|uniref:DUF2523 domain-containing protein n=2 Tax=Pseudomonas citronellolis TaxID=53408 RepID=UPI003450A117|nr:hypothetical protein [Pseudomonas citronellolis]MCP1653741.1 hypothetical protein [Pseudomonas citronellolis]MCP1720686.1 hypothetical protein [Pseudomonas citronellolis]
MMQFLFIAQMLVMIFGPLVKSVLRAIGFGFVTYVGINLLIESVRSYITSQMGQAGLAIQQVLGLAKVDVAIGIVLSAVITRAVLAGLNKLNDRKRRQVWNPPGRDYIDA